MVEVFATNISTKEESENLVAILTRRYPESRITIDLDDCDRVLRIQNDFHKLCTDEIMQIVKSEAYMIKLLV